MELITDQTVTLDEKRLGYLEALWRQGFGPTRCARLVRKNNLFDPSQEPIIDQLVRREWFDIQRRFVEKRRQYIMQMMALRVPKNQVAEECMKQGLVPSRSFTAAYNLVRKDWTRVVAQMDADDVEYLPAARALFIRQQERFMKDSIALAATAELNPFAKIAATKMASECSKNIARVHRVNVDAKSELKVTGQIDLAAEAGKAIIEMGQQVREGKLLPPADVIELAEQDNGTFSISREQTLAAGISDDEDEGPDEGSPSFA